MKISLRWIREFVDLPVEEPEQIASVLASIGHEVEGYETVHAPFTGVVVGRVERIEAHPNADRLRFCKVDIGGEVQDIVCGASNFEEGAVVPVSLPGADLAGGFRVGVRTIRGLQSYGMICSEAELGLGDDQEGILVLDGTEQIGADFAELLPYPDVVFDLSITSNRGDAMSVLGIARDLAAYYDLPLRMPAAEPAESGEPSQVQVRIDDPDGCPRYVGREVRDVRVRRSPLWMRLRLATAGIRPISNVVDITNYVLLELGQPLHGFDLDRIADETIVVRRGRPSETLTTLDGVERVIDEADLVIADTTGPVAFAGVMGGEASEVGDTTTRVLIEAAHFEPGSVMKTAKRLGLRTEASARFERGVDPNLPEMAARRAALLMARHADATVPPGAKDVYPKPVSPWVVPLSVREPERLLGVVITRDQTVSILTRLGFRVTGEDPMQVIIPTYRLDVTRPADLVEEVARIYGLDRLPERLPHGPGGGLSVAERRGRLLRDVLTGAGVSEASTSTFIGIESLRALRLLPGSEDGDPIRVRNPLREEEAYLRTSLLPGLLNAVALNVRRSIANPALFEIGRVFLPEPSPMDEHIPHQPERFAFVVAGAFGPRRLGQPQPEADIATARALWDLVARTLRLDANLEPASPPGFHPGRAARVVSSDGEVIGSVGELHPSVGRSYGIDSRLAAGEFDLAPLLETKGWWMFREPSPYPPVVFDLAFELEGSVSAAVVAEIISEAAGPWLEKLRLFDEFQGAPLPDGRKSLAFQVTLRSADGTLSGEDAQEIRTGIVQAVESKIGGVLRGGG